MSKEVYLSPKGIAGFMSVDKARPFKDKKTGAESKPAYSATVMVPKDAEALKTLEAKLQPVLDEYYDEVSKKDKTIKKLPIFPAELSKETGAETGNVKIKAKSLYAIQVLDSKKNVIKGVKVDPGSTIQIAFTVKPSLIKKECFLTFYLASVKVSKLSEGRDYSSMFEADEDEDGFVYAPEEQGDTGEGQPLADAVNI